MSPAVARLIADRCCWLFDLDGTLIDSAPAHEAAFRAALAQFAPDRLAEFRYAEHAGATTAEVFARLGVASALVDRLTIRKQNLYRSYLDDGRVELFPGAVRLLERLGDRGHRSYLVTSASRGSVEAVLASGPLRGRFQDVLCADDLPCGKPDPAIYREALRRWRLDPSEVVVVEDSANGVASAVGAGLLTLRVHGAGPLRPGPVEDLRTLLAIVSLLDLAVPVGD